MASSNVVKAGRGASGTSGKPSPIDLDHLDVQTLGDGGTRVRAVLPLVGMP